MTGHSDLIAFMRLTPNRKFLLSADTFGKIKINNFPNIFKMETVLFYKDDDIIYCDLLNDNLLVVVNSENEVFVWDLATYSVMIRYKMKESKGERLRNITCMSNLLFAEYDTYIRIIDLLKESITEDEITVDIKREEDSEQSILNYVSVRMPLFFFINLAFSILLIFSIEKFYFNLIL